MDKSELVLTSAEEAMLRGDEGEGTAMAMRVIVSLARTLGAPRLVEISSAHIDSCLYHGQVSLDFVNRLVAAGTKVQVPTTSNVGSLDLVHPGLVQTPTALDKEKSRHSGELMDAYVALGCRPTWTCAPYQLPGRPSFGDNIAWAESNATGFANSVLGARTDRTGDFGYICAAITARAPYFGLYTDEARRGQIVFDCSQLPEHILRLDLTYSLLGYLIGRSSGTQNPVLVGIPEDVSQDQLKQFGAAVASSGGVVMYHIVGVTPEAPTLDAALQGVPAQRSEVVTLEVLTSTRRELCSVADGPLHAVSVGTPHASFEECEELAGLLRSGQPIHADVDFYLSTGRWVLERARQAGLLETLESRGVKIVVDTCTYVTSILTPRVETVMTNSGKWAHYAPANIGVNVVLGSLEECVQSARSGRVRLDDRLLSAGLPT